MNSIAFSGKISNCDLNCKGDNHEEKITAHPMPERPHG
ncbi:MAG: hypothetical protein H6R38_211, partial [Deltaproteobacteria bacterium]|nr:hypothetical protein [Deltaproteobacteria bacterium]